MPLQAYCPMWHASGVQGAPGSQVVTGCPESVELSDGPIGGEPSTRATLASTSTTAASVPVGPLSAPVGPLSEPVGASVVAVASACAAMAASSSEGSDA